MEQSHEKIVGEIDKQCLTGNISLSQLIDVVGNMVGRVEEIIEKSVKTLIVPMF